MQIITVIPLAKGVFKENLTYFANQKVPMGSVVEVMVRKKKTLALVVKTEDLSSAKGDVKRAAFKLRKINRVKKRSIFRKEYLESVFATSRYSACLPGDAFSYLIPKIFKEDYDKIANFVEEGLLEKIPATENENLKNEKLLFQDSLIERVAYYKSLVRSNFAEKKSVFIVLPTHLDIEYFETKLEKGVERFVFTLHSGLSKKELIQKIEGVIKTEHPVLILATCPFLAIPRNDLKTIVLEKESNSAYKSFNRPLMDLRIFTEIFAAKTNAKLVMADTLLRFESLAKKSKDFSTIHPINYRYKLNLDFEIIDSKKTPDEEFSVLKEKTIKKIETTLEKNKKIFIFTLRKGLATETVCRDCNETLLCDDCSAPLVLYNTKKEERRVFTCNRCNEERDPDTLCANCGSWNLVSLGIGTETVYEEVKKELPKVKLFRLDKQSAKNQKNAFKIAKDFEKHKGGAILVGTQLALSYLKEPIYTSIVSSLDSLWSIPNFRMSEKVLQLILELLEKTEKSLLIQTKNPKEDVLKAIKNENISGFVKSELKDRKNLGYPPYKRFIKITHLGKSHKETERTKQFFNEFFKEYSPFVFKGFNEKLKGKYVLHALIKMPVNNWSLKELEHNTSIDEKLLEKLISLPPSFYINVDPENLL